MNRCGKNCLVVLSVQTRRFVFVSSLCSESTPIDRMLVHIFVMGQFFGPANRMQSTRWLENIQSPGVWRTRVCKITFEEIYRFALATHRAQSTSCSRSWEKQDFWACVVYSGRLRGCGVLPYGRSYPTEVGAAALWPIDLGHVNGTVVQVVAVLED